MDSQQGPIVHRTPFNVMGQPRWEASLGDTWICMAESLCCSSETTTTLLIGYTPIQNKNV